MAENIAAERRRAPGDIYLIEVGNYHVRMLRDPLVSTDLNRPVRQLMSAPRIMVGGHGTSDDEERGGRGAGARAAVGVVRGGPACAAGALAGRCDRGGDHGGLARRARHRHRAGASAGAAAEAHHQAGGPAAEQPGDRGLGVVPHLGPAPARRAQRGGGGGGLDRLRRRRPDDGDDPSDQLARPLHAAGVEDGARAS